MRRPLIDCTFCGDKQVPRSQEDVIPLWLVDTLRHISESHHPGVEPMYVEHTYTNQEALAADVAEGREGRRSDGRKVRGAKPVCDKLPDVCEICNGGWMHHLEEAVRPIIKGFIFGNEKVLDPYQQFVIATWITKVCLGYDAAYDDRWIPEEMGTRRFYETGYPLFGMQAHIGHDPKIIPEGALLHSRGPRGRARREDGSTFDIIQFQFQFDHLLLRAVINCFDQVSVDKRMVGMGWEVDSPHFVQVWPKLGRVVWPSVEARAIAIKDSSGQNDTKISHDLTSDDSEVEFRDD